MDFKNDHARAVRYILNQDNTESEILIRFLICKRNMIDTGKWINNSDLWTRFGSSKQNVMIINYIRVLVSTYSI